MKKIFTFLIIGCFSLAILFFSGDIILKKYFNRGYYYTPNIMGLTLEEGKEALKDYPFTIVVVSNETSDAPINTIFIQEPRVEQIVKKNRKIRVWVSKGPEVRNVPNVSGLSLIDAKAIIQSQGFRIGTISSVSSTLPLGTVLATDPSGNSAVSRTTPINFLVNDMSATSSVKMPDLLGLNLDDARIILRDNSLLLGTISYQHQPGLEKGIILSTNIEFNRSVPAGAAINLVITE